MKIIVTQKGNAPAAPLRGGDQDRRDPADNNPEIRDHRQGNDQQANKGAKFNP